MSDQGYTLAETLVAIAILALSIGGLSWGVQVLGRWQLATSNTSINVQSARAAQSAVNRLLAGAGPFRSDKPGEFTGGAQAFTFDCGRAAPCAVTLAAAPTPLALQLSDGGPRAKTYALDRGGDAHFVYRSDAGETTGWPPGPGARQVLRSVALVSGSAPGAAPILETHIWAQEPASCAFDPVLQDCR